LKFLTNIKQQRWFKTLSNKYVLILVLFVIWMLFFDSNNYFIHKELNQEINEIEGSVENFKENIANDREQNEKLEDSNHLELFSREHYYLKKENEDIFIITHQDSTDTSNE